MSYRNQQAKPCKIAKMLRPILLIDDDPNDREFAREALARANLLNETIVLSGGEEALDYFLRRGEYASRPAGNPAFVMLDLKMPRVDGFEVLKAVRANPQTAQVPVVMLTGSRQESDLAKSYDSGANAFVVKPIEFDELVRAIAEIGAFWAVVNVPPVGSLTVAPPSNPID